MKATPQTFLRFIAGAAVAACSGVPVSTFTTASASSAGVGWQAHRADRQSSASRPQQRRTEQPNA